MADLKNLLRQMAWERAKGELRSIMHSFYESEDGPEAYLEFRGKVEAFIQDVEDNSGWF